MQQLAENLWTLHYPLRLLGMNIGRKVTVIRLSSGRLVIHSTAPFSAADVAQINSLGEPGWLLDVSRFHDSFAREGREAFPALRYLVPDGFPHAVTRRAESLEDVPTEWKGELEVRKIDGMPKVQEHALFHAPSRTLIVADLIFNFANDASVWTRFVARHLLRMKDLVGMSPFFRFMISDRHAFERSIRDVLAWDFDRVIMAHGAALERGGKLRFAEVVKPWS